MLTLFFAYDKFRTMIILEYSEKRVPVIDLEEFGRISFSKLTSHDTKGYKFVCYHLSVADKRDSVVLDMNLQRKIGHQGAAKGFPKGTINPRLADWLRKAFAKYVDDDYFPYEKIGKLKGYLAKQDIEKIIAKPQRKRRVKKKNENT